jgi:hypothetical protein
MKALVSILALLVIAGWAVVFFKYNAGGFFHATLVIALVSLAMQWLPSRN